MQKDPNSPMRNTNSPLRSGKENSKSPNSASKRDRGVEGELKRRRIGLSATGIINSRQPVTISNSSIPVARGQFVTSPDLHPVEESRENLEMVDDETFLVLDEERVEPLHNNLPLQREAEVAVAENPADDESFLVLDDEHVEPVHNNLPLQREAEVVAVVVAEIPAVISHFSTYENRDIEKPGFLNAAGNNAHKTIFEQFHANGARFLSTSSRGGRFWGNDPSHEKTYIQPMSDARHQIYFPSSPRDIVYKGTWVSAVVREANGDIYPLHIITKNTLGAVKNLVGYPAKIAKLFPRDEFITGWPEGLGKECVVICVDNDDQRRQMVRDYEQLVLSEGQNAMKRVPNLRVYCRGALSELMTVEGCRQPNIFALFAVARPNLLPYYEKWRGLLKIEEVEIKARQGQIDLRSFENVCAQFFNPAPLSHDLALTHFSLTQLHQFCELLNKSRGRLINLKGKLYAQYKLPQIQDPEFNRFVVEIDTSIRERTAIISKLTALIEDYLEYSRRLSYLFKLAPSPDIESIERLIYEKVQDQLLERGVDEATIRSQFSSGKALCAWMLTRKIPVPLHNTAQLIHDVLEQMPRPENPMVRAI